MWMFVDVDWDSVWPVDLQTTTWNIVLGEPVLVPIPGIIVVPLQNPKGLQVLTYHVPEGSCLREMPLTHQLNHDQKVQKIILQVP